MFTQSGGNKNTAKKILFLNKREQNWNNRFILGKIPQFNAYNDINYLSLGLLKSKLRYEGRSRQKNPSKIDSKKSTKSSSSKRIFSATISKPKRTIIRKASTNTKYSQNKEISKNFNNYDSNFNIYTKSSNNYNNNYNNNNYNNTYNNNYNNNNFHYHKYNYTNNFNNFNNFNDVSIEEDSELSNSYQSLKTLWKKLGVKDSYIENIEFMLSYKFTSREEIEKIIITQITQMKQFKLDIKKIVEEVEKREKYINNIEKYDLMYGQLKENLINNNNYEIPESVQQVNQNLLEKDIYDCLKYLRLSSINVVYLFKKFKSNYYYLINGKLDTDFLLEHYSFDINYLSKLKHDTDFLKDANLNELYNFSSEGSDPFFLSISEKVNDVVNNENFNYKILPSSEELLTVAKNLMTFLNEEEILDILNFGKNIDTATDEKCSFRKDFFCNSEQNHHLRKSRIYEIGKNFRGDMNREFDKLIKRKEYNNLFFTTESCLPVNYYNLNLCKNTNTSKVLKKNKRSLTHDEITKTFKKYTDLKNSLRLNNEKLRKAFYSKKKYK